MSTGFKPIIDRQKDDILAYLEQLVKIESPSTDKNQVNLVIDTLERDYQELGLNTRRIHQDEFGSHLVAETPRTDGPTVLLVGHADTVFPMGTLSTDMPFHRKGDTLYGPGVMDMKGGLTTMLFGVKALLESQKSIRGNIRVVVNSDEEPGSPTSRPLWPELAGDADWAFVFEWEPEQGALLANRKGVGVFHLDFNGISAHAGAEPEKGASAILAMVDKIQKLNALNNFDIGTTLNVGVVSGGELPYVIADKAKASIDIRVCNNSEQQRIQRSLEEICSNDNLPGTNCTLTGEFHRPPLEPIEATKELMAQVEEVGHSLGQDISWISAGAVSDANNISAAGVPTIDGMGPYGGRAHSPDEFMSIPSLFYKTTLIAGILKRLVG
ncbi:M20 family metallopeptidase [Dethiosulfatarculus sandiegensis]|uniref:M20 family metallopeptidase n=1 Tax=Dethiosulfatarculus sandiegensis TaxID=1429043 RepID=UPI0005C8166D|nr:M20 family metallopeptidase [Dethiosulfatarculus sandiegensis]